MKVPKLLIFGYGNPGRGDDGLGPAFVDVIESMALPQVECQADMQLQVEHVMDMQGRTIVLFVDADMACAAPFEFSEIRQARDNSYSSHAMSPQALLYAYSKVFDQQLPVSFLLRIRGESFELGDGISSAARSHLEASLHQLRPLWDEIRIDTWREFAS